MRPSSSAEQAKKEGNENRTHVRQQALTSPVFQVTKRGPFPSDPQHSVTFLLNALSQFPLSCLRHNR
jgi:hypothetical protein